MIYKQIKTTFKLGIKIKTCLNLIKTRNELKFKAKIKQKEDELLSSSSLTHPIGLKFPPDPIQNLHPSHLIQGNSFLFSSFEKWMLLRVQTTLFLREP